MGDTIFIFCLALILFGPKKLPEIGRQIGKLMVEFRRASNEFKLQIEEELRVSEESERQKEITAAKTQSAPAAASSLPVETPAGEASTAAAPVIAPPATGLPVNHTFPSAEPAAAETTAPAEAALAETGDAYPESTNGFNPALNTASNSEVAEVPVAEPSPPAELFPAERFEPAAPLGEDPQKAQAPVHHG